MPEPTAPRADVPDEFDGCARECRKAGKHTLARGRCEHAPEPTPPSKDDLRGLLIAAGLTSHKVIAEDGHPSIVMHTNEEAADRALAVFREWTFGTREEIAARGTEAVPSPVPPAAAALPADLDLRPPVRAAQRHLLERLPEGGPVTTPDRTPTGDLPDECTGCGRDDGPMYLDPRPRHPRVPQAVYCDDCAPDLFDLGEESDHA